MASRAQHLQMPDRRLNKGAQVHERRGSTFFRVFCWDFAVTMIRMLSVCQALFGVGADLKRV